ncbi:MAG: molybdopterin-binding/glycosyltransferase family 2 protein [Sneathiella sp.]|nr:molybdopterin-binding/glycosyltransferase family 2 protein [Sneathiella sp.]
MIFGRLELEDAEGAILAHAINIGNLGLLKKGTVLTAEILEELRNNNETSVLAAKLELGDVPENTAAFEIAKPLAGINVTVRAPFTGRSNLMAEKSGIAVINCDLINKINTIDPSVTVASVKNFEKVDAGQMLATIKIIPFATSEDNIKKATGFTELATTELVSVAPFKTKKIGVISTQLPGTTEKLITKSEKVLQDRLLHCENEISFRQTVPHHEDDLTQAITHLEKENCDLILIFGASAITDVRDVVPTALLQAGGEIDHFGMPIDPGNLLLLGQLNDTCVIGLPGCTRSPKLNGFDWILQRILTDIPVEASDIMAMGEGGLLKEISSRPHPRNKSNGKKAAVKPKQIAAILLAAGQSRRMGTQNKLLALIDEKPMVRHVAETLLAANVDDILIVTGHEADDIVKSMWDLSIRSVQNPKFEDGISTSVKLGFELLHEKFDGILICLGDMPFVSAEQLNLLIDAFNPEDGGAIIVPTQNGKRGNPALISSQFWEEVREISGDIGAKALISANDHVVHTVEIDSSSIFADIDTPEILASLTTPKNKNSE